MATKHKVPRAPSRRAPASPGPAAPAVRARFPLWGYLLGLVISLYAFFEIYGPALHGPFVFDDLYLPYSNPQANNIPLRVWLGVRPFLGLSYWTDFHLWGSNTLPYHITNLLFHFASAVVLFFIFRKLLALASTSPPLSTILSAFGAVLFLLHPVQTEATAYIASRSETMSVSFFFLALCAFLYRRGAAINWPTTVLILFLFLLAIGSKEHTVTLPALLLLTDYFWNPGFSFSGIRHNARLYVPILIVGVAGAIFVYRYISADPMIGFHIAGLSPANYFFTECRALFKYIQLFLFPLSQSVDYDFPVSHALTEHGALLAVSGILFLIAAAFLFRKMYPLAAYGFFAFLLLLSPTSSFIPINDVIVERRLYLPFFALVIVVFEPLRRIRVRPSTLAAALAVLCCVCAYATWNRAHVWGDAFELFRDAARKAPGKARAHIGLGNALYHQGRCSQAVDEFKIAQRLKTPDYVLFFNTAAAYDCLNDPNDAIDMLSRSIGLSRQANAYALLGKVLANQRKFNESLDAFKTAIHLDRRFTPTYVYRAAVYAAMGQPQLAYNDYMECLRLEPQNKMAQQGLELLRQQPER